MNNNEFELHAIVHGRVQGVGFRATTCVFADQLNLVGTVRNCRDGTVEIYAQGTKEKLDQLLINLQGHHQISLIEKEYTSLQRTFSGFHCLPTF